MKVRMTYISQYILKTTWCMNIFGVMGQYDPTFVLKINIGHADLSWTFHIWTYFGIMSQYDPTFDLKINVRHCGLYFIVHWFCLDDCFIYEHRTLGLWVSNIWPKNKCRSLWPIFHCPLNLPYILKTISYINIILRNYESVWVNMNRRLTSK